MGERSGWYVFNETGDYQICVWGNWRTGLQGKWSSVDPNTLNEKQQVLKTKLEEAIRQGEEDKKRRQR